MEDEDDISLTIIQADLPEEAIERIKNYVKHVVRIYSINEKGGKQ